MKVVVVANGAVGPLGPLRQLIADADMVVAADGGANAVLEAGLPVTVIVGDMDSVAAPVLARWRHAGGATITAPTEKDETDLELALRVARDHDACRIAILGATGGRVDHELANLLLLAAPWLADVRVAVVQAGCRTVLVRTGATFDGQVGDLLSLLPVTATVDGIETGGLQYSLHGETLVLGSPRGVSNVFTAQRATVRLRAGMLIAVHTWSDGRALTWEWGG